MLSEPKTSSPIDQEAYAIVHGPGSEFNGTSGYSSEDDTRGARSAISGLRTSLRQARDRLQSRDGLVEDVMARIRTTRNPLRQDASADPQGHGGHTKAASALFGRPMAPNRASSRCGIPTPNQSTVSRSCSLIEEMPSSVESGAGPSIRDSLWGTKRRVEFAIKDRGSDAQGSKSKRGDDPMKGYEAMQTRIANRKKEREKSVTGSKHAKSSNKKHVKKTKETNESEQDANET